MTSMVILCFFIFPPFNSQNFFIYLSLLFLWSRGASSARARRPAGAGAVQSAERVARRQLARISCAFFPWFLKTRGLGTGAAFIRGSYMYT